MHLDGRTLQGYGFDLETDDLILLQLREDSIQYATFGPAIHAGVDRVPVAEPFGQAAPFAALFGHRGLKSKPAHRGGEADLVVHPVELKGLAGEACRESHPVAQNPGVRPLGIGGRAVTLPSGHQARRRRRQGHAIAQPGQAIQPIIVIAGRLNPVGHHQPIARPNDTVPDAKTLWLFREQLARHGLIEKLFSRFDEQLWQSGLMPRGGQTIEEPQQARRELADQ
jgi:hypothetical protein